MSTPPYHWLLDNIVVFEGRIRKEFDAQKLLELEESIFLSGQIQPVVITRAGELVCGERRFRAISSLHAKFKQGELKMEEANQWFRPFIEEGQILCVLRDDLQGRAALEAELAENLRRVDLTWQEQAAAVKQLHDLRVEEKGKYSPGNPDGQSLRTTAEELRGDAVTSNDVANVKRDISLAEFLDDPLVAAAKDPNEALKLIKRFEKEKDLAERAAKFDLTQTEHTLHLGDAYEWMQTAPPADIIITDPPYGRNMHKQGMANDHEYNDSKEVWDKWVTEMPSLLYAACKEQAHVYVFMDLLYFQEAFVAMSVAGFEVWKRPLIWDKGHIGSFGKIEYGPRHTYDSILFANKGLRQTIIHGNDVINITQETDLSHPAGKPVALLAELIKRSARPGDVIVDPMVGGGSLFPAATYCQTVAHGCEGQEKYYNMAMDALQSTVG